MIRGIEIDLTIDAALIAKLERINFIEDQLRLVGKYEDWREMNAERIDRNAYERVRSKARTLKAA